MAYETAVVAPVPEEDAPPVVAIPLFDDLAARLDEDEGFHRRGSPPWIITFADMISLLLAFFVLLLSFSDLNVTRFRDVSGSLQKSMGDEDAVPLVVAPPAQTQLAAGPATAAVPLPEQLAKDLGTLQKQLATDLVGHKIELRVDDDHLILQLPQRLANGVISQESLDLYARVAEAQAKVETLIEVRDGKDSNEKIGETARQLQQLKTALASEIAQGRAQVERDGERIEVQGRHVVAVDDGNAYLAAGVAGMGVLWLPQYMANDHVARGELVPLFDGWHVDAMPMYVAFPPNRHVSAKLRAFIDWVVELMALHAPVASRLRKLTS